MLIPWSSKEPWYTLIWYYPSSPSTNRINSLRPSDACVRQQNRPLLVQIMACLNQCWLIYIIITKNNRHLLGNRGAWRFFHDTYLSIEVQGIRCTNHLHDSFPLTDVNPHFTTPGCRYYFKINSWWSIVTSRHMVQPLAIVTSQWPILPTGIYGRIMLRSARVKVIAITCDFLFIFGPHCFNTGHC